LASEKRLKWVRFKLILNIREKQWERIAGRKICAWAAGFVRVASELVES
jgi:hypothetical protein